MTKIAVKRHKYDYCQICGIHWLDSKDSGSWCGHGYVHDKCFAEYREQEQQKLENQFYGRVTK